MKIATMFLVNWAAFSHAESIGVRGGVAGDAHRSLDSSSECKGGLQGQICKFNGEIRSLRPLTSSLTHSTVIKIENLTQNQPWGRFFVMNHKGNVEPLFTFTEKASDELEILAEDGSKSRDNARTLFEVRFLFLTILVWPTQTPILWQRPTIASEVSLVREPPPVDLGLVTRVSSKLG